MIFCATWALAAGPVDKEAFVSAKAIDWSPAPPSLPAGAKIAVLHGDPGKPGPFILRLMTPAGYKVSPHWHSQDEALTIISGTLYIGMGDTYEPSTARGLQAGGFHYLPAKAHHYAYSKKPTIVQISGNGPFDINYVNPADDPRKHK
jgi:mannose-6-phosphate isomerase-like protein (cupin superfamily)